MKHIYILLYTLVLLLPTELLAQDIVINEIQVANIDQFLDPSANYGGWIELYNPTDKELSLSGVTVRHTDADGIVESQALSSAYGKVSSKGYKVIWFGHRGAIGESFQGIKYPHPVGDSIELGYSSYNMSFKLDADGGKIEILRNKTVIDSYTYTQDECVSRCSLIRSTDGGETWGMTAHSTPGFSNNNSTLATERLDVPEIDTGSGVFTGSISFNVSIPAGQTLKYTTDGSAPSVYHGSTADSCSFTADETTTFRFALFQDGKLPSAVVTRTFVRDDNKYYLPILSVSSAKDNLFGDTIGCYTLKGVGVRKWERPVNMEYLIPKESGGYYSALNMESDLQIQGGASRHDGQYGEWEVRPSFRLEGKKVYEGINHFDYPYISSKPYDRYKSFYIRNGGQGCLTNRVKEPTVHELLRRSGMYLDTQAWYPVHIFLDGRFLGTFNIREAANENYAYSNYGIDTDSLSLREGASMTNGLNWGKWYDLAASYAVSPAQDKWNQIADIVEIDEYCNYMATEIYIGVGDWLWQNMRGFYPLNNSNKIHAQLYDLDSSFGYTNSINRIYGADSTAEHSFYRERNGYLFRNMMKYPAFKQQFCDTYCMLAGSVFEENRTRSIIDEMNGMVEDAYAMEDLTTKDMYSAVTGNKAVRIRNLKETLKLGDEYKVKVSSNIESARLLLNGQEIPTNKFDGSLFGTITLTAKASAGYTFLGWRMNTHTGSRKADAPAKVQSLRKVSVAGNSSEASGTTESYEDGDEMGMFDEVASTSETYTLTDDYEAGTFILEAVYHKITDDEARLAAGANPIRINEVSAGNDIYINDYFKKNDWVELYNTTDEAIDIAGMYLSDDRSNPRKYRILAMTTDPSSLPTPQTTVIPAHGTRIIWCDGLTQKNQLHAPFKLSNADGAVVSIMASDGSWQDVMEYKYQPRFCTYGRYPDGGNYACLMSRPTIDAANSILTQDFRAATEKEWASPDIAVTLGLFKGWNWTSHNMDDPVQASLFMPNALCIRDQKDETIKDALFGWVGNITTLNPAVGYKIKMEENTAITLRGNIFDRANTPVTILKGWNWIGMPLYSPCTLTSFFCNYEATEGDYIQGQEGFATYSGGAWVGSLTELTPGQAYLLKAGKAQQTYWNVVKEADGSTESYSGETGMDWDNNVTIFNATTESSGGSSNLPADDTQQMTEQYASSNMDWGTSEKTSRKETNRRYMCPLAASASADLWTCDIHAYPNVMSLIGELKVDDNIVSYGYTVAAFCGDECRGVAEVTGGKIYMNLHGEGGEDLTFKVCDNIGEQYPLDNAMTFTAQTLVGSMSEPYLFSLSTVTALSDADAVTIVNVEYFTLDGIRISAPGNGIYIKRITYKDGHVENIKTM